MDLVYNRAFPVGTKCVGGIGPDVHDLDWNPKPVMFDGATGVLACAISDRMRVFREERSKNYSASLLCDRKAPPGRSCLACKWALHDPMTLATGGSHLQSNAEQDGSGGIIRLLRYEDKHFNTMKVLKVDKGEDVSQLSWEREGRYLLATVNLGDGRAKIYVINHASRTRTKIAQIIDHPKSTSTPRARTFTTKFHPRRPIFISVGANQAWVWNKDRDWTLAYTLQLGTHLGRISRPPIICFDEYGERLAVCEFDDSVSVWTFTDKEITRIPKFELIARHVPAAADRRLLRGAVSIDWIKDKIVAADVHSIYLFSGNLRLITQGKLQLTCKRETHTHYYQQKCVKINPQNYYSLASGGTDGHALIWSCIKTNETPPTFPKRNYQKELAYYDEPPLPGPDGIDYLDAVDDWDTRTLITLPSSDEEDPDDVTEEDDEIEEVANKLHANLEIPPHTGHVADVTSQDDEHVAPSTAEVEVGAGKTIKGNIEDLSNKLQANMKIEPHTGHVAADATNQDDSGTGVALRGALPDEPWKIPSGKRIFCNRALNMKNIAAVGFHMEHTLAKYKYQEFGDLIYSSTLDKLVKDLSYPEELLQWKFDCKFIVRGLVIDKYEGNILKIDKNNVVELAFHGSREMPKEDIAEVYGNKLQASFEEPYYTTVDDLFSMVEAHLFSQLVTFKDNSGEVITEHTYEVMYRNVRQAFHLCCRDGSLNREFHKDLSRYIHIDLDIIPMLKMIRESGCRTFLVTDSFWDNTDAIMKYLCSPAARDYGTHNWLEYFDIVMTGCLKRNFFKDHQAGLLAVELCSGKLLNADIQMLGRLSQPPEQMQKVYQGGNAGHVKKLLAVGSSSQIFYASQQMYEDVFPSNKNLGWRTMLIIPELDQEISVFSESDSMREELKQLRITCSSVEDKIHHCNWYLRSQTLAETGKGIFEHERHELLDELKQLNENQRVANRNYQQRFNMRWGQIMKAGRQSSMFAHQAKSVPCIYTSSVTNLIHYDWSVEYSPQEDYMAHEFTGLGL